MADLLLIGKDYVPYHTHPVFTLGFNAYGTPAQEHCHYSGVAAQAWDRGLECAMRAARWNDLNVGQD
jgi:hypothetical protein